MIVLSALQVRQLVQAVVPQWCPSDLSCVHYVLHGTAVVVHASAPYSDAAGEDALIVSSVECGHDGC